MAENLRAVFDQIAPGWYNYRHRTIFRAELEALAAEWQSGKLLNLGCGHGADFVPFTQNFELYGIDFSGEMLKMARKYAAKYNFNVNLTASDFCHLPYNNETFDYIISVAALHHLKKTQQAAAFEELKRVLKPGGMAFITVWNRLQPRFWLKGKETLVPWKARDKILYRYYYLFTYGELKKSAERAGLTVIKVFPENAYRFPVKAFSRNICLLAQKN